MSGCTAHLKQNVQNKIQPEVQPRNDHIKTKALKPNVENNFQPEVTLRNDHIKTKALEANPKFVIEILLY